MPPLTKCPIIEAIDICQPVFLPKFIGSGHATKNSSANLQSWHTPENFSVWRSNAYRRVHVVWEIDLKDGKCSIPKCLFIMTNIGAKAYVHHQLIPQVKVAESQLYNHHDNQI